MDGSAIISTAIEAEETVIPPLNAVITKVGSSAFEDEMVNKLTSKLKPHFASTADYVTFLVSVHRLTPVCLCLSHELQPPFLYGISEAAYCGLQKIVSSCHSLLWVTGQYSEDLANQIIQGFAPCVREETKSLRFITASFDSSRGILSVLDQILLIYKSSGLDSSETFEREFLENNGILHTNRVVEADILDQHLHSITIVQPAQPKHLNQSLMQTLN